MNNCDSNKTSKQRPQSTTNTKLRTNINVNREPSVPCSLSAKDSEWVDIFHQPLLNGAASSSAVVSGNEAVLQLVGHEDGSQVKPLALMFPSLLEKDPRTLQGVVDKAMSTTEVTRHLVDLGEKANFAFMKRSERLIPSKQWLHSLTETSNSYSSSVCNYEADHATDIEIAKIHEFKILANKNKKPILHFDNDEDGSSQDTVYGNEDTNYGT